MLKISCSLTGFKKKVFDWGIDRYVEAGFVAFVILAAMEGPTLAKYSLKPLAICVGDDVLVPCMVNSEQIDVFLCLFSISFIVAHINLEFL